MKKIILIFSISLVILSCNNREPQLQSGMWRAVLLTEDSTEIPFNFQLFINETDTLLEVITGDDRYRVDEVTKTGDSLIIRMPLFSSVFRVKLQNNSMSGVLHRSAYTMPFSAVAGAVTRFDEPHSLKGVAGGRWRVILGEKELIGEFSESNERVTGSFLSPTGDYRFFEGVVTSEGKLLLSCFDGGFIRLFTAYISGDSLKSVTMHSGYSTVERGYGVKDQNAQLPDAYSVTGLKRGYKTIGFSFPNMRGEQVSLSDDRFRDKVVVVQISGSWCPNCLDESRFLMEMYNLFSPNLEVVCLTFERSDNFDTAKQEAQKLIDVAGITYDVLVTGYTPANVREALPQLENFRAFPTSLIIDKSGVVRRIHSGFSGPGTGVHYTNYVEDFKAFISSLIAE